MLIAACAAATIAIGIRCGDALTYVISAEWQNFIEFGSPPCSPQIPISKLF